MTPMEMLGECAAELNRREPDSTQHTTAMELLQYLDHRFRGEFWPIHHLHTKLFPERQRAFDPEEVVTESGTMRYDAANNKVIVYVGPKVGWEDF